MKRTNILRILLTILIAIIAVSFSLAQFARIGDCEDNIETDTSMNYSEDPYLKIIVNGDCDSGYAIKYTSNPSLLRGGDVDGNEFCIFNETSDAGVFEFFRDDGWNNYNDFVYLSNGEFACSDDLTMYFYAFLHFDQEVLSTDLKLNIDDHGWFTFHKYNPVTKEIIETIGSISSSNSDSIYSRFYIPKGWYIVDFTYNDDHGDNDFRLGTSTDIEDMIDYSDYKIPSTDLISCDGLNIEFDCDDYENICFSNGFDYLTETETNLIPQGFGPLEGFPYDRNNRCCGDDVNDIKAGSRYKIYGNWVCYKDETGEYYWMPYGDFQQETDGGNSLYDIYKLTNTENNDYIDDEKNVKLADDTHRKVRNFCEYILEDDIESNLGVADEPQRVDISSNQYLDGHWLDSIDGTKKLKCCGDNKDRDLELTIEGHFWDFRDDFCSSDKAVCFDFTTDKYQDNYGGVVFNGSQKVGEISNNYSSFSFWFKSDFRYEQIILGVKQNDALESGDGEFGFGTNDGKPLFKNSFIERLNAPTEYILSNEEYEICDNKWHHIVFLNSVVKHELPGGDSYYRGDFVVFIDGTWQGDISSTGYFEEGSPNFMLGGLWNGSSLTKGFTGVVDNLYVFDDLLSEDDIKELYEAGRNFDNGLIYQDEYLCNKDLDLHTNKILYNNEDESFWNWYNVLEDQWNVHTVTINNR